MTAGDVATETRTQAEKSGVGNAGLDRVVRSAALLRGGAAAFVAVPVDGGVQLCAQAGLPAPWSTSGALPLTLEQLALDALASPEPLELDETAVMRASGGEMAYRVGSCFGVALRAGGRGAAVFIMVAPSPEAWSEQELQRLRQLAGCAAEELALHASLAAVELLERAAEGFAALDRDWRFTFVNPAAAHMLGHRRSALLGQELWEVVPELRESVLHHGLQRVLRNGESLSVEGRWLQGGGWIETRAYALDGGVAVHWRDVTARRESEEELRRRNERLVEQEELLRTAFRDPLTGLANRTLVLDRIERLLHHARRHDGYLFAVLFLDLDRFKNINDALGHDIGDQLLVQVARRLETCVRVEDSVARLGGDEFALILDGVQDISDATRVAERVCAELAQPFGIEGREIVTSASVGIALSFTAYDGARWVLRDADAAMYRAKTSGRARVEVYDRAMHERAVARLQLERDLRNALGRDELVLHYHPVMALDDGTVACVDALLRWQHPQRGLLPPAAFMQIAEETGLIVDIGWWVVREACCQLRQWCADTGAPCTLRVSVNLSWRQFSQPDLAERLDAIVAEAGIEPHQLRLELREDTVMKELDAAHRMLGRLRARGMEICLDDFGTGFSSLVQLRRLPITLLKIDASFVRELAAEPLDGSAVETILALGRSLSIDSIAEGVETAWQLQRLRTLGARFAQGYLFSQPLSAGEVSRLFSVPAGS